MGAIAYTVVATLPDQQTASEYIAWLLDGHIAAVVRGGAQSGEVVRLLEPPKPIQVEARYRFASREAFDRYVSEEAPKLRAEGLSKFPPERGIRFERRLGALA